MPKRKHSKSKSVGIKKFRINIPPVDVFVIWGYKSFKEISSALKRHGYPIVASQSDGGDLLNPKMNGYCWFTDGGVCLWFPDMVLDRKRAKVVVHETNHAIHFICHRNQFHQEVEFKAYLQEHMFDTVCGMMRTYAKKKNKT